MLHLIAESLDPCNGVNHPSLRIDLALGADDAAFPAVELSGEVRRELDLGAERFWTLPAVDGGQGHEGGLRVRERKPHLGEVDGEASAPRTWLIWSMMRRDI